MDLRICATSLNFMWLATRAWICSVSSFENLNRLQIAAAMRTPTSTWPSKRMRSPVSEAGRNVGGLPTSWSRTPQARVRRSSGGQSFAASCGCESRRRPRDDIRGAAGRLSCAEISGKTCVKQAGVVEQFEATACRAFGEELGQFVANALGGDDMDFRGVLLNGGEGVWFDGVAEASGEANGAEHAQFVFGEPALGIANGADDACLQVRLAADIIEDFVRCRGA